MNEVYSRVEEEIPNLRKYAIALAHNPVAADDLLQQSVTRALVKSHLYRPGTNLRAWLFTIMHNMHVSNLRQDKAVRVVSPELLENVIAGPVPQDGWMMLRATERALLAIPDSQRMTLLLAGVEGMSYEEIARRFHVSVGTVKSRVHRGRSALRSALNGRVMPRSPLRGRRGSNARRGDRA